MSTTLGLLRLDQPARKRGELPALAAQFSFGALALDGRGQHVRRRLQEVDVLPRERAPIPRVHAQRPIGPTGSLD
jgi:hypothetical protein